VFDELKAPLSRVTLPDVPAPVSPALEEVYYPTADSIVTAVEKMLMMKEPVIRERDSRRAIGAGAAQ
jgi:hypothetical protein